MIASVTYNTSGSAGPYTITFPYLDEADIEVYLDGVANTAWTISGVTQLTLNSAPSAVEIEIRRNTDDDPYVDFTDPAAISAADLDTATLQAIYIAQEAEDHVDRVEDEVEGLVLSSGNVPAPPLGDVGKFLKATATNTFGWTEIVSTDVSDSTAAGRAVLTAASNTAIRQNIVDPLVDAKGDLLAGTAADTLARVAVGANRTILEADSTATPGVAWVSRALGLKSVQVFTADGTWTRPTGIRRVLVEVIGGGGGGGGVAAATSKSGTGGGGAGTAIKILDVSAIASATITVGAGGAGATAGANAGVTGNTSSWADGTNTISGIGGTGGSASLGVAGGAGGTATGGDMNFTGQGGGWSVDGLNVLSTAGGNSSRGFGGPGVVDANGQAAAVYGGGGSGGNNAGSSTTKSGGAGSNGIVIVYEYE